MEDAVSAISNDKYFVEEETPIFRSNKENKDLKITKTQEFSEDNRSGNLPADNS